MFDALISWLDGLWKTFEDLLQGAWNFCWKIMGWIIAAWLAVLAFVQWCVDQATTLLHTLIDAAQKMVYPDGIVPDTSGITTWLDMANTFFPVYPGFAILIGLGTLWIAATTYRTVKSYIPGFA